MAYVNVSLDGYFVDSRGDMRWAHRSDPEWRAYVQENSRGGAVLLFGRVTYDLMASYWPTPLAAANDPVVAERMNNLPKVVFSRTLDQASWKNTKLVKGHLATEVRKMKEASGENMVLLGSGSVVGQLAEEGLIDEYQIVLHPIVLGGGRTMFEGVTTRLNLKLTRSRAFGNGTVVLCYEPAA
jgi:dihydrofolate reductase